MGLRSEVPVLSRRAPGFVPDMIYTDVPGLDRLSFRCEAYRAALTRESCGDRWRTAQTATGYAAERVSLCRGCPIGAVHAGYEPVIYSRHFAAPICPRCRRGSLRMIGDRICVSCFNRKRELVRGFNARGNEPVVLKTEKPLHAVEFKLIVGGKASLKRVNDCVDLTEPLLQTLRTTKGDLAFAFAPSASRFLRQARLF